LQGITLGGTSAVSSLPLISMTNVSKQYDSVAGPIVALCNVSLEVQQAEFVAIIGKSGSGKTTLINLLTGIDSPSSGIIRVASTDVHELGQEDLSIWRGSTVGIVFQFFQLLPMLTVEENVMLPMDFCNTYPARERRPRSLDLLARVGIADQAGKLPTALSGGQQQRAAIARALANDPPLIVADEPTGNLDSRTSVEVMEFFAELVNVGKKTVVMVTHERDLKRYFARSIALSDGKLVGQEATPI
jgi:putative ABC transport system ATP-binding protein